MEVVVAAANATADTRCANSSSPANTVAPADSKHCNPYRRVAKVIMMSPNARSDITVRDMLISEIRLDDGRLTSDAAVKIMLKGLYEYMQCHWPPDRLSWLWANQLLRGQPWRSSGPHHWPMDRGRLTENSRSM